MLLTELTLVVCVVDSPPVPGAPSSSHGQSIGMSYHPQPNAEASSSRLPSKPIASSSLPVKPAAFSKATKRSDPYEEEEEEGGELASSSTLPPHATDTKRARTSPSVDTHAQS